MQTDTLSRGKDTMSSIQIAQRIFNMDRFILTDEVKRHEAKTSDKIDIYEPGGRLILECREPDIGIFAKASRFYGRADRFSSFDMVGKIPESQQLVFRIRRKGSLPFMPLPPVEFFDAYDTPLAQMKKKTFSLIGNVYLLLNPRKEEILKLEVQFSLKGTISLICGGELFAKCERSVGLPGFEDKKMMYEFSFTDKVKKDSIFRALLLPIGVALRRAIA